MTARTVRRSAARSERNRHLVNQHRNQAGEGGYSRQEWAALGAQERSQLVSTLPRPCLICDAPAGGPECPSCTATYDRVVARLADV